MKNKLTNGRVVVVSPTTHEDEQPISIQDLPIEYRYNMLLKLNNKLTEANSKHEAIILELRTKINKDEKEIEKLNKKVHKLSLLVGVTQSSPKEKANSLIQLINGVSFKALDSFTRNIIKQARTYITQQNDVIGQYKSYIIYKGLTLPPIKEIVVDVDSITIEDDTDLADKVIKDLRRDITIIKNKKFLIYRLLDELFKGKPDIKEEWIQLTRDNPYVDEEEL